jgi:hypothetical protein
MKRCSDCLQDLPLDAFMPSALKRGTAQCRACRKAYSAARYRENPERGKQQSALYAKRVRLAALRAYSQDGPTCACCGEVREEFLAIDHIDGGGNEHRREIGIRGKGFFLWLKREGFPPGFRVLCHNCNCSRGYSGYCPHETEWSETFNITDLYQASGLDVIRLRLAAAA